MGKLKKAVATASIIIGLGILGACSTDNTQSSNDATSADTSNTIASTTTESLETSSSSTENKVTTTSVATTSESETIDWASLDTTEVALTDEGYEITKAGTYILSGSSTGSVTVNTDGNVRIILNNATITSSEGAAIYIESADSAVIELAEGTTNTLEDAATRSDEEIDGALYSADDLTITGEGTLNVTANFADGIVGKDDLWIEAGTINVTSVDDGIRGKDSLTISGGTIVVDAAGDGIKSSNDTDLGKGQLTISGGNVQISSGDDAIKAEQKIWITGGTIDVVDSVEGVEAPVIVIDDGDLTVYATDDGINAAASAIVTTGISLTINGGNVTVEVGQGDTDALDSNGDLTIAGGVVTLTAQSAVDYDGTGSFTGGTLIVNGETLTELPQETGPGGMGGGFGGGGNMGTPPGRGQ